MAIRFQCASCNQPIEVDDEWASRLVSCPFCSKTITAPAQSTLVETAIPAARPQGSMAAAPHAAPTSGGGVAVAAALLAGALLLCLVGIMTLAAANRAELEEFQALAAKATDFNEQMKLSQEFVMRDGGMPGWIMGLYALAMAGGVFWLAAVICGIIAVLRPARRQFALGALIVCAATPLLCCCGGLLP